MDDTSEYRIEHDSMGEVRVPAHAKWRPRPSGRWRTSRSPGSASSAPTSRPWPGSRPPPRRSTPSWACSTRTSPRRSGRPPPRSPRAAGTTHFPVDVFQTGSGTSSNMNTNEVIATLATERLGRDVHPNDHVNASQSSNDVFPSSIHIAATAAVTGDLIPALEHLAASLERKAARVRGRREVRPYPSDGRHAGDPRPGVRRLRGPGPVRRRAAATPRCPASPNCRSAARRWAPASTPRPASPPPSSPRSPARPGCR